MPCSFFSRRFPHYTESQMRDHQVALGLYLEDLYSMLPPELQQLVSRYVRRGGCPSSTPPAQKTTVSSNQHQFHATLDVHEFKPEEISVRVVDNTVIVEGKHEDKEDEHGSISRHFVRKYNVSGEFDLSKVESRLSSDGVLSVTAPRVANSGEEGATVIPVILTGRLSEAGNKSNAE